VAGPPASVEGVDRVTAAYQAVVDDARNMTEAHRAIASAGETAARSRAPVGATGSLAGTITGTATERDATLGVGVAYWNVQEFGSRYIAARRFMRAGTEAMTLAAPEAYTGRMSAIIGARTR